MWKKFALSTSQESRDGQNIQVVRVEGYLDSSTFPQLQEHLKDLIDQGSYRILVDFEELNYISSAGLGVLMGMLQEVRDHDGDLKVARMSDKIRNLFDMLGFSRLVRIYEDIDDALSAFGEETASPKETSSPEESY